MPPPERWDAYCPIGTVIPGTKFIAFKVPLKEPLLHTLSEKDRFSPNILMALLEEKNLTLAGVIDLTYTWKYYDKKEFLDKSVGHKKVFTKGHEVPSDGNYREFIEAVESFNNNDNLIGVHCTHGVNRTGYLICRYMIEKLDMNPQEAIDLFNTSRGHNIERENYITDLKLRKRGEPSLDSAQSRDSHKLDKGKKPRWRLYKQDHRNWRQAGPYNPMNKGASPAPVHETYPKGFQRGMDTSSFSSGPQFSDHFRAHRGHNNEFQHHMNCSRRRYHSWRRHVTTVNGRQAWSQQTFHSHNVYYQQYRPEKHMLSIPWEQDLYHNDIRFSRSQQQQPQRSHRY